MLETTTNQTTTTTTTQTRVSTRNHSNGNGIPTIAWRSLLHWLRSRTSLLRNKSVRSGKTSAESLRTITSLASSIVDKQTGKTSLQVIAQHILGVDQVLKSNHDVFNSTSSEETPSPQPRPTPEESLTLETIPSQISPSVHDKEMTTGEKQTKSPSSDNLVSLSKKTNSHADRQRYLFEAIECKLDVEIVLKLVDAVVELSNHHLSIPIFTNSALQGASSKASVAHVAARLGHAQALYALAERFGTKAVTESRDIVEATPLLYAATHGQCESLSALCTLGANVNVRDKYHNNAFLQAVRGSHRDAASLLLLSGADANMKGKKGDTPLAWACSEGREDLVHFLLEHCGASLTVLNENMETPLFRALKYPRIVHQLLEYASQTLPRKTFLRLLTSTDYQGRNVLYMAIDLGCLHSFCVLAKCTPAGLLSELLNAKDKKYGHSALHRAVFRNRPDLVHLLCLGHEVDVNIQDVNGRTPLHMAMKSKNRELVRILLIQGLAYLGIKDNQGITASQMAKKSKLDIEKSRVTDQDYLRMTQLQRSLTNNHRILLNYIFDFDSIISDSQGNISFQRFLHFLDQDLECPSCGGLERDWQVREVIEKFLESDKSRQVDPKNHDETLQRAHDALQILSKFLNSSENQNQNENGETGEMKNETDDLSNPVSGEKETHSYWWVESSQLKSLEYLHSKFQNFTQTPKESLNDTSDMLDALIQFNTILKEISNTIMLEMKAVIFEQFLSHFTFADFANSTSSSRNDSTKTSSVDCKSAASAQAIMAIGTWNPRSQIKHASSILDISSKSITATDVAFVKKSLQYSNRWKCISPFQAPKSVFRSIDRIKLSSNILSKNSAEAKGQKMYRCVGTVDASLSHVLHVILDLDAQRNMEGQLTTIVPLASNVLTHTAPNDTVLPFVVNRENVPAVWPISNREFICATSIEINPNGIKGILVIKKSVPWNSSASRNHKQKSVIRARTLRAWFLQPLTTKRTVYTHLFCNDMRATSTHSEKLWGLWSEKRALSLHDNLVQTLGYYHPLTSDIPVPRDNPSHSEEGSAQPEKPLQFFGITNGICDQAKLLLQASCLKLGKDPYPLPVIKLQENQYQDGTSSSMANSYEHPFDGNDSEVDDTEEEVSETVDPGEQQPQEEEQPHLLKRVTYISKASASVTTQDLKIIAESATRNNGSNGITGMLLFSGGLFYQVIEGMASDLNHIVDRIAKDPRHYDIYYLKVERNMQMYERQFSSWAMNTVSLDESDHFFTKSMRSLFAQAITHIDPSIMKTGISKLQ